MSVAWSANEFWSQVNKTASCWLWCGHVTLKGYGELRWKGRSEFAHRVAFFITFGYWPVGLHHKCETKRCVNPDHVVEMNNSKHKSLHVGGKQKTHCIHGHELTKDNTYTNIKTKQILCKTCVKKRSKNRRNLFGTEFINLQNKERQNRVN